MKKPTWLRKPEWFGKLQRPISVLVTDLKSQQTSLPLKAIIQAILAIILIAMASWKMAEVTPDAWRWITSLPWKWIAIVGVVATLLYLILRKAGWREKGVRYWKPALWTLAGVVVVGLVVLDITNRVKEGKQKHIREARAEAAEAEAHKALCKTDPYAEGCYPKRKELTGIATPTGPVVVVIPPHYKSELWGDTTKMRTELRRSGKLKFRYVWAKAGVDTVHVTAIVSRKG